MEITFRPESFQQGRRSFLGHAVLLAGGAAAGVTLPASLLQASPACIATDLCGDWQLDDICSSYPPYSFQRDAGYARHAHHPEGLVDPLDALFAA